MVMPVLYVNCPRIGIMPKKVKNKVRKPFTVNNWVDRFEADYDCDHAMLCGHMACIDTLAPELIRIAKTAKDFDDLKKQVLKLAERQEVLIMDIQKKWHGEHPENYGLPRLSSSRFPSSY
jgi:hypothetical protein